MERQREQGGEEEKGKKEKEKGREEGEGERGAGGGFVPDEPLAGRVGRGGGGGIGEEGVVHGENVLPRCHPIRTPASQVTCDRREVCEACEGCEERCGAHTHTCTRLEGVEEE
eukprot:77018-Rhodomonas_salina.1